MPLHIINDDRCVNYHAPGHPERPQRISRTLEKLRSQQELKLTWDKPADVPDETLLRAHTKDHLARVKAATDAFDADTPAHPGIHEHALRSIGGGLRALALARKGGMPLSLLRPPGHHALGNRAMGFCYLNQVAVTVLEALAPRLEAMGHRVRIDEQTSGVHAIAVTRNARGQALAGGADPRREGVALGD